jgi:uncharacterized membrane protein
MSDHQADPLNQALSKLLRNGVVLSASVLGLGLFVLALGGRDEFDPAHYSQFDPARAAHGPPLSHAGNAGELLLNIGLLVLMLVPVARLAFSVVLFARQRDRLYTAISVLVLVIIAVSTLLSQVE